MGQAEGEILKSHTLALLLLDPVPLPKERRSQESLSLPGYRLQAWGILRMYLCPSTALSH